MKKILSILIILILLFTNYGSSKKFETTENNYDLIIIAPENFIPYLQQLAEHKNSYGVKTLIKNVDEIYLQFNGKDNAEKIKYYIKHTSEELNAKYILLIGGRKSQSAVEDWWIPVRYAHISYALSDGRGESRYITDLYYADIYNDTKYFSSWDTDGDGIYSEWPYQKGADDIMDLAPDIAVGRIPCRTENEVKIIVKKIICYEHQGCDESWFKNIVGISFASDLVLPGWDGESIIRKGLTYMENFTITTLFASDGTLTNSKDVVNAINKGCGFLWFFGGGSPKKWGVILANQSKWTDVLYNFQIPLLRNHEKFPILIDGSGCHNCQFNVSIGNTLINDGKNNNWVYGIASRCQSERFLQVPNGGCIAIIGPTAIGHDKYGIISRKGGCDWLDIHFFEQYNTNKTFLLGDIWKNTLFNYVQNFTINWDDMTSNDDSIITKAAQTWSLFGDPSLKIGGYNNY